MLTENRNMCSMLANWHAKHSMHMPALRMLTFNLHINAAVISDTIIKRLSNFLLIIHPYVRFLEDFTCSGVLSQGGASTLCTVLTSHCQERWMTVLYGASESRRSWERATHTDTHTQTGEYECQNRTLHIHTNINTHWGGEHQARFLQSRAGCIPAVTIWTGSEVRTQRWRDEVKDKREEVEIHVGEEGWWGGKGERLRQRRMGVYREGWKVGKAKKRMELRGKMGEGGRRDWEKFILF